MKKKKLQEKEPISDLIPLHPTVPSSIAVDGTAHHEISIMQNPKYSQEIIEETAKIYDFDRLVELKSSDMDKFLAEAETQIHGLWHGIQALATHTDLFLVTFQIAVGKILNEVESSFEKKSDYIRWFEAHFGDEHIRLFQQSKQLAEMGPFAKDHASLGKNRLLQFDGLRKALEKPFDEILLEHPFPDTARVTEELFSEHIDGIITFERCRKVGIEVIEFDQARLMACYNRRAVEVETLKKLKAELDRAKNKKTFLENFLMEKMQFSQERVGSVEGESLQKRLLELDNYLQKKDVSDSDWLEQLKPDIDEDILLRIHKFLGVLIRKLKIRPRPISTKETKEVQDENS
jgi:hypothetical protein